MVNADGASNLLCHNFSFSSPSCGAGFDVHSTGNVIKQLVHASSCAPPSYGALGKFGEHSRN